MPKGALPADLWSDGSQERLVLVTCGGWFDRASRSYSDNVIVWAVRL